MKERVSVIEIPIFSSGSGTTSSVQTGPHRDYFSVFSHPVMSLAKFSYHPASPRSCSTCENRLVTSASSASLITRSAMQKKHGVKIEPAFIPLFKATLRDLERTKHIRQGAKSIHPKEPQPSHAVPHRRTPLTFASTCPPRPPAGKSRPCDRTRDRCRR